MWLHGLVVNLANGVIVLIVAGGFRRFVGCFARSVILPILHVLEAVDRVNERGLEVKPELLHTFAPAHVHLEPLVLVDASITQYLNCEGITLLFCTSAC